MGDSMKKIVPAAISLLAIVLALWFVFSPSKTGPDAPEAPISQSQKPSPAPVAKPEDKPIDSDTALMKPPVVALPQPHQPATSLPLPSANAATMELITGDNSEAETNVFKEVYIKRSRPIAINPQVLDKDRALAPGARLNLALFPDAKYSVTLQVVNRSPQGDISASGILDGEEYGTFSLSTASGVTLMRLADPTAHKLFLIRCHGPDRTHYAVEIDPTKVPAPKHSVPVSTLNKTATE